MTDERAGFVGTVFSTKKNPSLRKLIRFYKYDANYRNLTSVLQFSSHFVNCPILYVSSPIQYSNTLLEYLLEIVSNRDYQNRLFHFLLSNYIQIGTCIKINNFRIDEKMDSEAKTACVELLQKIRSFIMVFCLSFNIIVFAYRLQNP